MILTILLLEIRIHISCPPSSCLSKTPVSSRFVCLFNIFVNAKSPTIIGSPEASTTELPLSSSNDSGVLYLTILGCPNFFKLHPAADFSSSSAFATISVCRSFNNLCCSSVDTNFSFNCSCKLSISNLR